MDNTNDAEQWADSVVKTLSLREKVAQLFMPALYASDDEATIAQIRCYADSCVGGVVLLKGDSAGAASLAREFDSRCKVPPVISIDAEWGLAMRLVDAPRFPANSEIDSQADDQLLYEYGRELARECRLLGINMVLGPVVDVAGDNGFLRRRSFGPDPVRVADMAVAYARGLEDGGVISVAKHFPGHGSVSADSHKQKGVVERSLASLDSIDLYPYRCWIDQHLSAIMVGHLAVPAIDSRMLPAAVSPTVITDLLKDDLGFKGLVITDAMNMGGVSGYDAVDALLAGADIIIAPVDTFDSVDGVVSAIGEGRMSENQLDEKVKKILLYKYLFGFQLPTETAGVYHNLHSANSDSISVSLRE